MHRPKMTRRDDSLIGQVVAANVVLVALTLLAASLAAGIDDLHDQRWQVLVLALALVLTFCVNLWMLQRRFRPLDHLIRRIERIDPAEPATFELEQGDPVAEIDRLAQSFKRLLDGIAEERKRAGQLVMRAQEEERRRLARDLHDEVNQALTAILLRLEALSQDAPPQRAGEVAELKRLVNQAMEELLNLARQLRPSALDDHGLVPAIDAQLKRFAARSGVQVRLTAEGDPAKLGEDAQTAIYRTAQEALSNISHHAAATAVEIDLNVNGTRGELRVRDNGQGFDPAHPPGGGLGLQGMAERARLVGGELDVRSSPGGGTTVTLRIE
jgi:two-component system, NarL family, sensor histidine kinase UhpB